MDPVRFGMSVQITLGAFKFASNIHPTLIFTSLWNMCLFKHNCIRLSFHYIHTHFSKPCRKCEHTPKVPNPVESGEDDKVVGGGGGGCPLIKQPQKAADACPSGVSMHYLHLK